MADRKVQAILSANAFLAATFQGGASLLTMALGADNWFSVFTFAARIILLACIATTAVSAILAMTPRLISPAAPDATPTASPFFLAMSPEWAMNHCSDYSFR